jgi:glycosyltransferase involved in cell wall biosynthesis
MRAAIAAVRDQLLDGDELLIVIDHNQELLDNARSLLAHDSDSVAERIIANENHRGLSGARNTGIAAASGTLMVFLDDDAVPRPDWLARLTEPFADTGVIGTGGVAAPAWEHTRPDWLPDEFLWVVGCSYRGLPQLPEEIRNPIGANMAFRRSVILHTSGFTDGIGRVGRVPLGCEETEFSIRAARVTGGRIVQQPAAQVDHQVTADRMSVRYFVRRCWAEGISKAFVSRLTGSGAALASERPPLHNQNPPGGDCHGRQRRCDRRPGRLQARGDDRRRPGDHCRRLSPRLCHSPAAASGRLGLAQWSSPSRRCGVVSSS